MKSVVALITLVVVAAGGIAHATEMVEVPNPPPYLPPPKPTPEQQRRESSWSLVFGGVVLLAAGVGLEGAAAGFAVDHPCALPLSCIFGPPTNDSLTFAGLVAGGALGLGGGVAMTVVGATRGRQRRPPVSLRLTGSGMSLSGRF
jgi:hypothetical protein